MTFQFLILAAILLSRPELLMQLGRGQYGEHLYEIITASRGEMLLKKAFSILAFCAVCNLLQ